MEQAAASAALQGQAGKLAELVSTFRTGSFGGMVPVPQQSLSHPSSRALLPV